MWSEEISRLREESRIDAEHFQPVFDALEKQLSSTGQMQTLGEITRYVKRGVQPRYVRDGEVLVINSEHVGKYLLNIDAAERTDDEFWEKNPRARTRKHDILMNSTGLGSIGRVNCVLHTDKTVVDNHVTIIRVKERECDPLYLAVYLNSRIGRMQTEKWLSGSSGQLEIYPDDIKRFLVVVPAESVQAEVAKALLAAHVKYQAAMKELDAGRRRVESLVEIPPNGSKAAGDEAERVPKHGGTP